MEVFFPKGGVSVPRPVINFFLKALVVFVVWKVLYLVFLLPARTIDRPLTRFIGSATAVALNLFGGGVSYTALEVPDEYIEGNVVYRTSSVDIRRSGLQTLRIADACNGLELIVLYLGFIACFPAPLSKKIIFSITGCLLITVINILRCASLVQIFVQYRKYLDFSHHFAFTFLIYGIIFLLWFYFTKNLSLNGRKS